MNLHMIEPMDLRRVLASRARTKFSHRINFHEVSHRQFSEMHDWCENNCRGLWNSHNRYAFYFQFEDDQDAVMFNLKYGHIK